MAHLLAVSLERLPQRSKTNLTESIPLRKCFYRYFAGIGERQNGSDQTALYPARRTETGRCSQ